MSMIGNATIKNERGIHARPSSEVAKEALKYKSKITITYNGKTANAKDVLQIIILELFKGTTVSLSTDGEDEKPAFEAIKSLLEKEYKFD
jgi:phosphocarrier protein HPr